MKIRSKSIGLLLFLSGWLASFSLYAQQVDIFTLLDESKKNYPTIKARQAEINSADHEVSVSSSDYLPKISVQHQYTYGTNNSIAGAFYPNPAVISPSGGIRAENTYVATWGSFTSSLLEWNAFNFGKVSANVNAAKANLKNSEAAYENEVFQHQVRVSDAYLLTLVAEKLSAIQLANLKRATLFRQVVDAGVRSGMRPGVDSSLAHAEHLKASLLYLDCKRNEKAQAYRLAELTGAVDKDIELLDSMMFYTALPVTTDTSTAVNPLNPELRFYQTRMLATQARSVAIKRSFLPSITLVGAAWARGSGVSPVDDSFQTDFSGGTQYKVYNYLLGVSTRWTLTDFIPVHQRYKSEKYRSIRDHELYQEQSLKINRQLRESEMQYELQMEQARTAPLQLAAALQAYQQANARYKSGLTDLPTMLQSMVALNRAEADLAIAYSNAWRSLLSVAAAKGDLTIFLDTINH